MTTKFEFVCEQTDLPRLDVYLAGQMADLSRSRIQKLIDDGYVQVNDIPAFKTGIKLEPGFRIAVEIPDPKPTDLIGEDIPLTIMFENDDVMVINKPAGMVVHPSAGHSNGTLVNAAIGYDPEMEGIGGEGRPGVVHRLDKDTSGIILMAKNDTALAWLQTQFKDRLIEKQYIALVDRRPPTPEGRVEAPIGRDPANRQKMAIVSEEKGREAISIYKTIRNFKHHTLIEIHPLTGRTHQIRVHMAFLGCPVAGDTTYGFKRSSIGLGRHFLHASRLTVQLPGESEPRTFQAELPEELEKLLARLS